MSYVKILKSRIPLNNSYENVISFKNVESEDGSLFVNHITKENYFKSFDSEFNNLTYYQQMNVRYGDIIRTEIVYDFNKFTSEDVLASGFNYCHIRNTEQPRLPEDLYYFVTNMAFLNGHTARLSLELDIFTTFFDKITFDRSSIYTKRCHCNRFNLDSNGTFGCEEALLGDKIDGQFGASILKNKTKLITTNNNLWLVVYFASNSLHGTYHVTAVGTSNAVENTTNENIFTEVNNIPAPYQIGVIPINTINVPTGRTSGLSYGLNYEINGIKEIMKMLLTNPDVYSVQLSSFDFTSFLSLSTSSDSVYINVSNQGLSSGKSYILGEDTTGAGREVAKGYILCLKEINSLTLRASINLSDIIPKTGIIGYFPTLSLLKNMRTRIMGFEPKLYTNPYSLFTYSRATDKENGFEPFQSGVTANFQMVFTPNPLNNGERVYLTSGDYSLFKSNYNGSSPISSSEIGVADSTYGEFISSQKNSFYTGVGISYFNNAMGIVGGIVDIISGRGVNSVMTTLQQVGNTIAKPFEVSAKIKDLRNVPNKLAVNNYDIYSVLGSTDFDLYLNTWTMLDVDYYKAFDFFYRFGYNVEMNRNVEFSSTDYAIILSKDRGLFTRTLFNYLEVEDDIDDIISFNGGTPLSNTIRKRFDDVFNRGVRIWNIENVNDFQDFTLENKEETNV